MIGEVRRPLFLLAVFALVLVVLVEVGSGTLLGGGPAGPVSGVEGIPGADPAMLAGIGASTPPGIGIRYLALVDGFLLFSVVMLGISTMVSQRAYGRVQGVVTLVVSVIWLLLCLAMALAAFVQLIVMISLLLAPIFGTMAYVAIWGFFPTSRAAAVLGLLVLLKLVFVVCLVLAQQRFLQVKWLMAHIATSFVLQLGLGLVHGLLPRVVVSIGDQLVGLVIAVVALVGSLITLIFAIPAVVNAIRVSAPSSGG